MVRILKVGGYITFFILALMYFMPKVSSYYYVEQELEKHKIILSHEEVLDNGFSLQLNHVDVSFDSIESASIQSVKVKVFVAYNSIYIEDITLESILGSFFPLHIKDAEMSYSIFKPLEVMAKANGDFGSASAEIHLLDRNISATIRPSKLMLQKYKRTLLMMKKQENGEYIYDKAF
ncbi:MAG: hypothetical protein ACI9TV_000267 [Sulfurimonas sp.]|jgi:hypothetical protein|uniref:hypothetical protein n=1 Tax=Sulfurimonas sp. TaxID=2022749 RepID=UPI0039E47A51